MRNPNETGNDTDVRVAPSITTLERAINGDKDAFVTLAMWNHVDIRRMCRRLLNDSDNVDDVLQDTYLRAYQGIRRFSPRAGDELRSFFAWVSQIAYRTCVDFVRVRSRRQTQALIDVAQISARDASEANAFRVDMMRALADLTLQQRAAVLLVDVSGFSYDDAASIMGVPRGTVASSLNRGRKRLRDVLIATKEM